jgi:hypothetical protein
MDAIGWFIATTHQLLGHDKTAALIGQSSGNKEACLLCQYERTRSENDRLAVLAALAPEMRDVRKEK